MTDTLAMTTAKMLREHFHTSGMTKEVADLDKAIEAEAPKPAAEPKKVAATDSETFGVAAETHNG